MAKKRISILDKKNDFIEKDKKGELNGELFDINSRKGLINIPLIQLVVNPNQPRKTFHEESILELAESIKEHGILNPIIVRPSGAKYEIIAGERRFRAAGQAGLKEVPAIIKKVSDEDAKLISLIENIQREDLNAVDRATALKELKVTLGVPWVKLGQKLGLTKSRILDLVGLLGLPEEIQDDIRQKKLTEKHGRALRQLIDQEDKLSEVATFIKDNKLTGDQSLNLVRAIKSEPRFTIEESYNTIKVIPIKVTPVKKDPLETAISEAEQLIKTLEDTKLIETKNKNIKPLRENLEKLQKAIEIFLKTLKK